MSTDLIHFDVRCSFCRKKFGYWAKTPIDQPPCPKCKHKPDTKNLVSDAEMIAEFQSLMVLMNTKQLATPDQYRKMRLVSGLTIGQASHLLEIPVDDLKAFELSKIDFPPTLLDRMKKLYSGR